MKFIKKFLLFILFAVLLFGVFKYVPDLINKYLITTEDIEETPGTLIKQLASDNDDKRWDAYNKLTDRGKAVLPVLKKAAVSASTDKRTAEWIQAVINSIEQDSADEDKSSKERTDREKSSFEKSSLEYIFRNYKLSFGFADEIYDGDTVKLEDGTVIRYLGVDTPEIIHGERGYNESGGQDAYHENRVIVSGKRLIIAEPKRSKHDSYGRLLAYIYAPVFKEGDYCLNVSRHLVEEGYGEEVYGNYDRNLPLKIGYLKLKEFVKGE